MNFPLLGRADGTRVPAEFHCWYLFVPPLVLLCTTAGTFVYHCWYNPTCSVLVRPASAKIEHPDMSFRANGLKSHAITWNVTQNLTQRNALIYSKERAFCVRLWHFSPTFLRARVKERYCKALRTSGTFSAYMQKMGKRFGRLNDFVYLCGRRKTMKKGLIIGIIAVAACCAVAFGVHHEMRRTAQMRTALDSALVQNRNYVPFTSDSTLPR